MGINVFLDFVAPVGAININEGPEKFVGKDDVKVKGFVPSISTDDEISLQTAVIIQPITLEDD